MKAIRHNICIYSSHTPMDRYLHGISGRMAEQLGITDYQFLTDDRYGVVGYLPQPLTPEQLLQQVKQAFGTTAIRYTRPVGSIISKVAFGGGACAEFIDEAIAQRADAFITADFKHHQFLQADGNIMVLDIGHFESEHAITAIYQELLSDAPVRVLCAQTDKSPVMAYC